MVYISLTSITVGWNPIKQAKFWYWAIAIMTQAQSMALQTGTTSVDGARLTMTAWNDRKEMLHFIHSGAHMGVMKNKVLHTVSSASVIYSYEADRVPTWDEAIQILKTKGRGYDKIKGRREPPREEEEVAPALESCPPVK
jgi:hypothetical protein